MQAPLKLYKISFILTIDDRPDWRHTGESNVVAADAVQAINRLREAQLARVFKEGDDVSPGLYGQKPNGFIVHEAVFVDYVEYFLTSAR